MIPADITRKLGIYGRAYDLPETKRAYTYRHQPDNVMSWRLGAALELAQQRGPGGDLIDAGLNLLAALEQQGFGVFEIDRTAKALEES